MVGTLLQVSGSTTPPLIRAETVREWHVRELTLSLANHSFRAHLSLVLAARSKRLEQLRSTSRVA